MLSSIRFSLKNLFKTAGRDGRRVFWHYFFFVVLVNVIVLAAASLPSIVSIAADAAQAQPGQNSSAIEAAVLERMIQSGLPARIVMTGLLLGFLNLLLLAASFVRRAHDVGFPGLIVVIPIALQLVWMYFSYGQLGGLTEAMKVAVENSNAGVQAPVQPGMIAQDLIGWLVVLIVILVGMAKSQHGANKYGEGPVSL